MEEEGVKTIAVLPVDGRIRMRTLREVANVLGAKVPPPPTLPMRARGAAGQRRETCV